MQSIAIPSEWTDALLARWWQRRGKRLTDGAPVNPVALGEGANREVLPIVVAPDLFEQFHP